MTKPSVEIPAARRPSIALKVLGLMFLLLFLASLYAPGLILPGSTYFSARYWLPLFSKYMALALFALSVDLIWGYTGLLSLGQGLYFGIGAYMVGYSLKLQQAAQVAGKSLVAGPDMAMPDFMEYCRMPGVPPWIAPLINIWLALTLAVLLPLLIATIFGWVTFRLRIKGVFFALITQALVLAVYTLVVNQQPYTGGVVGMTYLAKLELFGHKFVMADMYFLVTTVLVVCFLGCFALVHTKFGKILTAIRDNENRVLALGYNTAMYKTFIFAISGALAGLAGALFVSAYGTTGPDSLGIAWSIEVVVWVAAGGRGTLIGAVLGAVLVGLANTYINDKYSEAWPVILGGLLIGVVLLMPAGILGGLRSLFGRLVVFIPRAHATSNNSDPVRTTGVDTTLRAGPPCTTETLHAKLPPAPNIQAVIGDVKGT